MGVCRKFLMPFAAAAAAVALGSFVVLPAAAVDTVSTKEAPDLASARAMIDKKDFAAALVEELHGADAIDDGAKNEEQCGLHHRMIEKVDDAAGESRFVRQADAERR